MSYASSLGTYLRSYRQASGMTAQDVAQRCQVPVSVILDLEHGDRPDAELMQALSQGLSIPLVDLHRIAQGELPGVPAPVAPPAVEAVPEPVEDLDRSPTMLEAVRGLSPAQIEKVMDYIQLLKQAELGRRRATPS